MKDIATMLDELSYKYDSAEHMTDRAIGILDSGYANDKAIAHGIVALAIRAGHITELLEQIIEQLAVTE